MDRTGSFYAATCEEVSCFEVKQVQLQLTVAIITFSKVQLSLETNEPVTHPATLTAPAKQSTEKPMRKEAKDQKPDSNECSEENSEIKTTQ